MDRRGGPFPAAEILACRNGLIHLPCLVTGKQHFAPPTPRFFSPNCLDFDFNLQAPRRPPGLLSWRSYGQTTRRASARCKNGSATF